MALYVLSLLARPVINVVCVAVNIGKKSLANKKGDRFNIEDVIGTRGADHDMLLERATVLYEMVFGSGKGVRTIAPVRT